VFFDRIVGTFCSRGGVAVFSEMTVTAPEWIATPTDQHRESRPRSTSESPRGTRIAGAALVDVPLDPSTEVFPQGRVRSRDGVFVSARGPTLGVSSPKREPTVLATNPSRRFPSAGTRRSRDGAAGNSTLALEPLTVPLGESSPPTSEIVDVIPSAFRDDRHGALGGSAGGGRVLDRRLGNRSWREEGRTSSARRARPPAFFGRRRFMQL
jgi:hypothetical protein